MKGPAHDIRHTLIDGKLEERRGVAYACDSGHRQGVWMRRTDAPTEQDAVRTSREVFMLWFGGRDCADCRAVSEKLSGAIGLR